MADKKPSTNYYQNLGGINLKASEYTTGKAQFLDLRNLDFDVPNALQKRPGSTNAIASGTSGAITSLYEFVKLSGSSYIIAGSDTAMFYTTQGSTLQLLSPNWNNGQPTDMLTFVDKLWMANGQNFQSWGATGTGSTATAAGLPGPMGGLTAFGENNNQAGVSWLTVAGLTMLMNTGGGSATYLSVGVAAAWRYVRADGYYGPLNVAQSAFSFVHGSNTGN